MGVELKGTECRTGSVSFKQFSCWDDGRCVQLTFRAPDFEVTRPSFGIWYMQLNQQQARELAQALEEFAEGTREEIVE